MLPETVVVVVGRRNGVKDVLLHHSFRNTVNALYLTLHDLTLHDLSHHNLTLHDPQRHHFACLRRGLTLKEYMAKKINFVIRADDMGIPSAVMIPLAACVMVVVWLVFCLVIITGYSSSLIAHLTIQGKIKPPETVEDLVSRNNWRWGLESWLIKGAPGQYFKYHTDPVMQEINKKME
ncbi:uncharacterized protein, partial [Cherax quadricarinatus]|uniref:uncharacterized protein n=1 Tax=Cherax quadricarinatus TaxID=27406 RepID=UPI00387E92C6